MLESVHVASGQLLRMSSHVFKREFLSIYLYIIKVSMFYFSSALRMASLLKDVCIFNASYCPNNVLYYVLLMNVPLYFIDIPLWFLRLP